LIDIHTHILPGIDDGAADQAAAVEAARRLEAIGVTHVVATPHVIPGVCANDRATILAQVTHLQAVLDAAGIRVCVLPGAEYYVEPELPEKFDRGMLLTLNDRGRHLLVELPATGVPSYVDQVFFDLLVRGVTPVLAHPERNRELAARPAKVYRLLQKGVLIQVTAGSLVGLFGRDVRKAAELFIGHRWVQFIASDLHGPGGRLAALGEALPKLTALLGREGALKLFEENPRRVLDGAPPVEIGRRKEYRPPGGWFSRLIGRMSAGN
jgi:protein-tyrosine phosphatase